MATSSAWAAMMPKTQPGKNAKFGWHIERCCDKPKHDSWYVMHSAHIVEVHHDQESARKRARHLFAIAEPGPTVIKKPGRDEQRQYGRSRG